MNGTNEKKTGLIGSIVWLIASIVLIIYAFAMPKTSEGKKEVSLCVQFAEKSYNFEELTTDTENLFSFFAQYNAYLQLGFYFNSDEEVAKITGFKGSFVTNENGNSFKVLINGAQITEPIEKQNFKDGDEITIRYENSLTGELALGGNDTMTKTPDSPNKTTFIVVGAGCAIVSVVVLIRWIMKKKKEKK